MNKGTIKFADTKQEPINVKKTLTCKPIGSWSENEGKWYKIIPIAHSPFSGNVRSTVNLCSHFPSIKALIIILFSLVKYSFPINSVIQEN